MFLNGDRVCTLLGYGGALPGTGLVVGQTSGKVLVRTRLGEEREYPVSELVRAPLVLQPQGGYGYELQPGQQVLWMDEVLDEIKKGEFDHYLSAEERKAVPFPDMLDLWDAVLIQVDGKPRLTSMRYVYAHPRGVSHFPKDKNQLDRELGRQIEKLMCKLDFSQLDWNGHGKNGAYWDRKGWYEPKEKRVQELIPILIYVGPTNEQAQRLIPALETGTVLPDDEWVSLGRPMASHYLRCPYCSGSEYDRHLETNGVKVRISGACPNPTGDIDNYFNLNVPSGRLIFSEDLYQLAPTSHKERHEGPLHRTGTTAAYAGMELAYGYVGGYGYNLYRTGKDAFALADKIKGHRSIRNFHGDDRWYSAMDYNLAQARCQRLGVNWEDLLKTAEVVKVKKGLYYFTQHNDIEEPDGGNNLYTEFYRVCDALPVLGDPSLEGYLGEQHSAQFCLAQSIRDWPSLYERETPEESIAAAASHILCTNGNGIGFHPNGHPLGEIDSDIEPVQNIPIWNRPLNWYPMSPGYCTLFRAAGLYAEPPYGRGVQAGVYGENLNPSFQELGYRILQNIILYGLMPHYSAPHESMKMTQEEYDEVCRKGSRTTMHDCVRVFHLLSLRYPETFPQVDEAFTAWMVDTIKVTAWVDNMALDPPPMSEHFAKLYNESLEAQRAVWKKIFEERTLAKNKTEV